MTYEQLKQRVNLMSNRKLIFSNQYGMLFILSENNEILLNITSLVEQNEKALIDLSAAEAQEHLENLIP